MKEIWYESATSDIAQAHKVLGGPYGDQEAQHIMIELQAVHDSDFYWLEDVARIEYRCEVCTNCKGLGYITKDNLEEKK